VVVMNPQELIDAVNTMNDGVFKQHVIPKKNDFADWIRPINKNLAEKLSKATNKAMIISILESSDVKK
ncbi:MAG: hypothetical protein QQN55_08275, partial [Nitrosopumilus sp.]